MQHPVVPWPPRRAMLDRMALPALGRSGTRADAPAGARRPAPLPAVTYGLIAVNVLVLLLGPSGRFDPRYGTGPALACVEQRYEQRWGAVPVELLSGHPLTAAQLPRPPGCPLRPTPGKLPALSALSSLFVHAGWSHLVGNVLFLFVFGPGVEERFGQVRFLLGYLTVGTVATYGYALAETGSAESYRAVVGASGAIAGVLGGYLRLYPRARVTTLVPVLLFLPLRLPAWLVLGLWFALQWWSVRSAGPGVAYPVHLIGFSAGWLLCELGCRATKRRRGPRLPRASAARTGAAE